MTNNRLTKRFIKLLGNLQQNDYESLYVRNDGDRVMIDGYFSMQHIENILQIIKEMK